MAVFLVPVVMALVCSVRAIPEEAPLIRRSSSIDWLNPFTWFYRGDGERNNEEMKGGGGSSVINLQSQRKILRRPRSNVSIVRNRDSR